MLTLFLVIAIIVLSIVLKLSKPTKVTNDNSSYTYKITTTTGENTQNNIATNKKNYAHRKRMEHLSKREANRERKQNAWTILRFIIIIENVVSAKNFYDFDKALDDFQTIKTKLLEKKFNPTNNEFEMAIRLCSIKYTNGECSHKLTTDEIQNIHNWETYNLNYSSIANNVVASFKTYWDDVLAAYKRPSARLNRINYLINHLNEMKKKETIQQIPNFEEKINELILYYSSML